MRSWVQFQAILKFNDFYANLSKIISPLSVEFPQLYLYFCKPTETDKTMINWGCSSVEECMLCMYEVMGSIPSISKHCLMTSSKFKQNNFTSVLLSSHNCIIVFVTSETEKTVINWRCISVVERMLRMYEVLGSIPSISKHRLCLMTFMQI